MAALTLMINLVALIILHNVCCPLVAYIDRFRFANDRYTDTLKILVVLYIKIDGYTSMRLHSYIGTLARSYTSREVH